VVGLGPAGSAYLTGEVRALMDAAGHTFLRTARHPAAEGLSGFVAFDHLYESATTFAEVYRGIVDELVAAATAHAPDTIVYAVPGSPLVAERTVELLRHEPRVDVTIVPSLSFLDLAWERLGIDPLAVGVRLIDAEQFSPQGPSDRGPLLVAQCWSQSLLSDIKLSQLYDGDGPEPEVVLLHHLGLEDEQVMHVGWWDLDRALEPDHLTSLYIPALCTPAEPEHEMARLTRLVETLRQQCPWDKAQTHGSLMPHLLEEAYEVLDALREVDTAPPGPTATESGHHLADNCDRLFAPDRFRLPQPRRERFAGQQLHGEKQEGRRGIVVSCNVVDRAKIGVGDLAGEEYFLLEATRGASIACDPWQNYLEGNAGTLEEPVCNLVDFPHPTASNIADHGEAVRNDLAGFEAADRISIEGVRTYPRAICSRRHAGGISRV